MPVFASAATKSVCLAKKAGSWIISRTLEAKSASSGECTSEIIKISSSSFISLNILRPFSIPGPLKEFADVLFALSNDALKIRFIRQC